MKRVNAVYVFNRDNNSATVSLTEAPLEASNCVSDDLAAPSGGGGGDDNKTESGFLPRACLHRYGSPPSSRSVSFVRDLKTGDANGSGHDAGCRAKAYKRQSMSVGDSIDERVEANFDYLSVHSLAEEPGLECCAGGSDIVAMVAATPNAPICCAHNHRLQTMRGSIDALTNSARCQHGGAPNGLTDVESCHARKCLHSGALRVHGSASSGESTSVEMIGSSANAPPLVANGLGVQSNDLPAAAAAVRIGEKETKMRAASDSSSGSGSDSVCIPLFISDSVCLS